MPVRRTHLDHCHIAPQCAAAVELLSLAEEYRNVVGISALDAMTYIGPDEESLMEEYPIEFRVGVWGGTFGVQMVYAHIFQFSCLSSAAQCLYQYLRSTRHTAQVDVVP